MAKFEEYLSDELTGLRGRIVVAYLREKALLVDGTSHPADPSWSQARSEPVEIDEQDSSSSQANDDWSTVNPDSFDYAHGGQLGQPVKLPRNAPPLPVAPCIVPPNLVLSDTEPAECLTSILPNHVADQRLLIHQSPTSPGVQHLSWDCEASNHSLTLVSSFHPKSDADDAEEKPLDSGRPFVPEWKNSSSASQQSIKTEYSVKSERSRPNTCGDTRSDRSGATSPTSSKNVKSTVTMASASSRASQRKRSLSRISRRTDKSGAIVDTLLDTPVQLYEIWTLEADEDVQDKVQMFKDGTQTPKHVRHRMLGIHPMLGGKTFGDLATLFKHKAPAKSKTTVSLVERLNKDHATWKTLIRDPSSIKLLWWYMVGALLIGYDLVYIPLTVFDLPQTAITTVIQFFALVYWALDIPATFLVGYHTNGILQMDPREIAKRYFKTFFAMDVGLVLLDVVVVVLDRADTDTRSARAARAAKSWRLVRMLRGLRLIRLLKLPSTFAHLMEHIQSDSLLVMLGIVKLTAGIVMLNHFIACFWYGIGSWSNASTSWVDSENSGDKSTPYLYLTSLHWSLTQFTPASTNVHPTNIQERAYTVIVIMFALVTFSSFVSSITNAMTFLRNINSEQAKSLSLLQRYLKNNQISISLCVRIRRHLDYKLLMHQQSVQEKDVQLLQMLSVPLRHDLHYEVYSTLFTTHLFFKHYDLSFKRCMKRICSEAVESLHVSEGDVLFCRGDEAKSFFIVQHGNVRYRDGKESQHDVVEGMWMGEAVLWTPWVYHGQAKAQSECLLMLLDSWKFQNCAQENRAAMGAPSYYARLFVEHLNSKSVEDFTDLRDESFEMEWAVDVAFVQLPEQTLNSEGDDSDANSDTDFSPDRRASAQSSSSQPGQDKRVRFSLSRSE